MIKLFPDLKKLGVISCFILCLSAALSAQDAFFSQFFLNPVYMNPAYSGTMQVPRAGVQYRNQWPAMDHAYTTYFASFDTYLPRISSGIGVLLYNDVQGDGIYKETSFKIAYSKEIRINREWMMYGSLSAGAQLNSLDFGRLIFADGLDAVYGHHVPTAEMVPDRNNYLFPDFGSGLLFFNSKYFIGFAVDHLAEPNQSIYSDHQIRLSRKYTGHLEINIPWYKPGHLRKYCTFNPNVIIQSQGNEHNITLGLYANRKGLSLGLWARQTTMKSTDLIAMAGFVGKQLKTAITYDINLTGVGLRSQGAVEISISYLLKSPGKRSIFPFYEIPGEWDIR